MTRLRLLILAVIALLGVGTGVAPAVAQSADSTAADTTGGVPAWHEDAWTEIITHEGVRFTYIFYSKADTKNNGVVVRLENQNAYRVHYAFTIIFRTPTAERSARADGHLDAGEMKTGDKDGLFWIPFTEPNQTIGEIGLRGLRIVRAPSSSR
jgi:hypothetical protein